MEYLNVNALTVPLFTAVGAFGGMPTPPKVFTDLTKNVAFQWLMVWVLIMQGGGGMNATLSTVAVMVVFVLVRVLDMVSVNNTQETFIRSSH